MGLPPRTGIKVIRQQTHLHIQDVALAECWPVHDDTHSFIFSFCDTVTERAWLA
jgi:hypothetical protein